MMRWLAVPAFALLGSAGLADEFGQAEITALAAEAGLPAAALLMAGDAEYGAYLGGECIACHQTSGDYDGIPPIIYMGDIYFRLAMHEYKAKSRENPVMQLVAGRLGAEEIAALAVYFTALGED